LVEPRQFVPHSRIGAARAVIDEEETKVAMRRVDRVVGVLSRHGHESEVLPTPVENVLLAGLVTVAIPPGRN